MMKTLLQWIAASLAGRELFFMTFKDESLSLLPSVVSKYSAKPVGELLTDILAVTSGGSPSPSLFEVLLAI